MHKILIVSLILSYTLTKAQNASFYTEIPFVISNTGQIIIETKINNYQRPAFFFLETNGSNILRADQPELLISYNIIDANNKVNIQSLELGNLNIPSATFRIKSSLHKRGEYAFPKHILGTLGMKNFNKKIIRLDFKNKKFIIAENLNQFEFSDSAIGIGFRNSFINYGIHFNIETRQFGKNEIAVDTRSPLGIHFFYNDLSANNKNWFKDLFTISLFPLNGRDPLPFRTYKSIDIFVEDDFQITDQTVFFSDYLPNCIGNDFLGNYIVTIDYKKNIIYFDPINQEGYDALSSL